MASDRRKTRSSGYQYILVEKSFSHEMLESFPEDEGMQKKLNPFAYNEEILLLEDQLKERFWELIRDNLTVRQLQIVELLKGGATQSETARQLNVNQSSITKCISKESLIHFSGGEKITISELWEQWKISSQAVKKLEVLCVNPNTGYITSTTIMEVMRGEPKELIRISLESGASIKASRDHKLLTRVGWKRLEDILSENLEVAVENGDRIKFVDFSSWEVMGMEETFDLEVLSVNHNFVGNGFILRNSLNGNTDYSKGNKSKPSYGGICKKLAKIVEKDPIIKDLTAKIAAIRNESWI